MTEWVPMQSSLPMFVYRLCIFLRVRIAQTLPDFPESISGFSDLAGDLNPDDHLLNQDTDNPD